MSIVQIGEAFINPRYLISARRWKGGTDPPDWQAGDFIIMMRRGEPIRFSGGDADLALRTLSAMKEPIEPRPVPPPIDPPPAGTPLDQGRVDSISDPPPPGPGTSGVRSAENGS